MVTVLKNSYFWMYTITGATFIIFTSISVLALLLTMKCIPWEYLQISIRMEHTMRPFATVILLFCALKAMFSIISMIGIKKELPLLIAIYFGYGTFMAITIFIAALLLLLWMYWAVSMAALIFDAAYVYCLVKMHDGYESIVRGKSSSNLEHNMLLEEEVPA